MASLSDDALKKVPQPRPPRIRTDIALFLNRLDPRSNPTDRRPISTSTRPCAPTNCRERPRAAHPAAHDRRDRRAGG
jgi:hypothetical protein